ncbi:hypothetical protein ACIREM_41650 [Streptomyces shenzhenensis]|uniref:hypothetical protein n=1 Tax=Streptomyces shenzhenensis TaxID=943815 RepID=UPI0037F8D944
MSRRGSVILSVRPYDEPCLFGNGGRTGKVSLVALALNLYDQRTAPTIDFCAMRSLVCTLRTGEGRTAESASGPFAFAVNRAVRR